MKKSLLWLIFVVMFVPISSDILAQEKYPDRPITAIIPYPPGSMQDLVTRAMGDLFPKYIGQPLVVSNKPGSGGLIGGAALATSKPDGYTIGTFSSTQAVPEIVAKLRKASYTSQDVLPVANLSGWLVVLGCNSDAPYKSFNEFVDFAKKNPGKMKFGHSGVGNFYWMLGMAMAKEAGIELKDVPFSGESEYRTALLGNHIDIACLTYGGPSRELIQSKKFRALVTFEKKRIDELPDVPTIKEVAAEFRHGTSFIGVFVPKGTPQQAIDKLSETTRKITEDSEFKEKMKNIYMPIMYMDAVAFRAEVKRMGENSMSFLREKGLL
jgi:tripartite-type tricarboxylate transporter receptor subunit TctC